MNNKCFQCGGVMKEHKENARFDEGGIDIVLRGVSVWRCPKCGESETAIPEFEKLHQVIAMELVKKRRRLTPKEVRFLRKFMGYSTDDFAKKMHVDRGTVSHWESPDTKRPIGKNSELLLRAIVLLGDVAKEYPLEEMATEEGATRPMLEMSFKKDGWRVEAA